MAQAAGPAEAEVAAQIAARDFARPLKWIETESRDTRENAAASVALLRAAGVTRIVLVHPRLAHAAQPARLRAGDCRAAAAASLLVAAPMGLARDDSVGALRWLPSQRGFSDTRHALREYLGPAGSAPEAGCVTQGPECAGRAACACRPILP